MDLFDAKIEAEVQKRLAREIDKVVNDPAKMIQIYQQRVMELEPKATFYDLVTQSDDEMDMATAVKSIKWAGKPIGRNKMFAFLRNQNVLMSSNEPYQRFVDAGYFRMVETSYRDALDDIRVYRKTVVTQMGLEYMIKLVNEGYND